MSIKVTISGIDLTALKRLEKEYSKIQSYDGSIVNVTVKQQEPSYTSFPPLIQTPEVRRAIVRELLGSADAALRPIYAAYPKGHPLRQCIEAADARLLEFIGGSETRVYTNRAEYMRDNFDVLNRIFLHPPRKH